MQHDRKHNLNAAEPRDATQHDRKHNLNAAEPRDARDDDHSGERDVRLSAKSLAARGDAPDGSRDGPARASEQADGSPEE